MRATYQNLLTALRRSPGAYDAVTQSPDLNFDWSVGDSARKTAGAIRAAGRIRTAYHIAAAVMAEEDAIEEGLYCEDGIDEKIFDRAPLATIPLRDPRVRWTRVPTGHVSTVRGPSGVLETAFLRDDRDDIEKERRFGEDEAAALRYHDELVASLTTTGPPRGGPATSADLANPPADPHATTATAVPPSAAPRPTEPPGSSATTTAATGAPAGSLTGPVGHHPAAFFFCLGVLSTLMPFNANAPKRADTELRIAVHRVYVAPESAAQEWLRRTAAAFAKRLEEAER